jgi:hypothetical protein
MKTLILSLFLFLGCYAFGQIPGSKFKGPFKTKFREFKEGDTLQVGYGSNPNGDFRFIYQPPNYIWGTEEKPLTKMMSNSRLIIKHFKEYDSPKMGLKFYTVVSIGSIVNNVVELEPAIESGEIIIPGYTPASKVQVVQAVAPLSVADELSKLKKLLDDGVLTQAEYDTQKKKLLGN